MAEITVWTKQNRAVLEQLNRDGRFIAREDYMRLEMEDTSDIMMVCYNWLSGHMPSQSIRPADAKYPIWVSMDRDMTMMPQEGYVILELAVDEGLLCCADITKWTRIINYSYIPLNKEDEQAHNRMLADYGIDDAKAMMTPFYPIVRREIIKSWERLFDDSVVLGGAGSYGLLWEVRSEWIRQVTE